MVATKLSEVAGKGWGWYSASDHQGSSPSSPSRPTNSQTTSAGAATAAASASSSSPAKGSSFASRSSTTGPPSLPSEIGQRRRSRSDSIVDTVVATNTSSLSSSSSSSSTTPFYRTAQSTITDAFVSLFSFTPEKGTEKDQESSKNEDSPSTTSTNGSRRMSLNVTDWNTSVLMSPTLLKLVHNPYISVRGPGRQDAVAKPQQSMEAVRNLLCVVPLDERKNYNDYDDHDGYASDSESILDLSHHSTRTKDDGSTSQISSVWSSIFQRTTAWYQTYLKAGPLTNNNATRDSKTSSQGSGGTNPSSPDETASQLAEGTLRAYRDLALDEAVELHASLRYYSDRWERPFWSWFQAGPTVWFSPGGYNHQDVGKKVSQIQAVLARRLSTIGELQQHLLKSGWQRGVAQWGFLGEGGEWAAISGTDGRMEDDPFFDTRSVPKTSRHYGKKLDMSTTNSQLSEPYTLKRRTSDQLLHHPTPVKHELPIPAPISKTASLPQRSQHHNQLYYTNLFVKKNDGGHILVDGTALADWSIDAMLLVRKQLFRAANGQMTLPFSDNWVNHSSFLEEENAQHSISPIVDENGPQLFGSPIEISESGESTLTNDRAASVPKWASSLPARNDSDGKGTKISDLPLLVEEVSALLDVMEEVMDIQRARRLEKLKPPSWWRQNWFLTSVCAPVACYVLYSISMKEDGMDLVKFVSQKVADFFQEHVVRPCYAIYHELTKGTEYFSDRAARDTAISTLKKMIRSWLDETYPDMLEKDKDELSEAMDISLIEITKERSMKTIYELNSVLRMSFIEAQFIKKEMMNALVALDEMQASTNFNMNLAAITPFVILVWSAKKVSSFVFYTTFKWGKSRAETYASFLHILTEIERLLIMRLNPPNTSPSCTCILDSDDLGMLMLHLHELRTIMWNERRRFSLDVLRSVSEDLAELSGERGAVSVQQQLYIVERMSRTYAFLKNAGSKD
ncbi:ATP synthase regulation protein NCA2 [Nitzschia inconspicua]|uniref:ATP synthase regulation protein NCA2 n=1 Tax=Nitzschia inconspicua TaxID=303405 RepID=A0A9K3LS62_9STRA|nr:ATP synthase regulation protein NCA2 [Nitzschia inconspicua]